MRTKIKRFSFLDGLETFQASGYHADFPLHSHDQICITLVTEGVECTQVGESELIAPFQGISLTYPEEIHANPNRNDSSYSFLTFYISPEVVSYFNNDKVTYFKSRVIQDPWLYRSLVEFSRETDQTEAGFGSILKYLGQNHLTS
ncbi:MAG: AraC family ligand binding domain-containing protein, partial [Bacteroidota bacterium]